MNHAPSAFQSRALTMVFSAPSTFKTTSWSLVLAAAHHTSLDSRPALARLCETYWKPVYAFIRRSGFDRDRSQDLTQGFFTLLLAKNYLGVVDPQRGRFRSFLLTAVKRFLANEHDRACALKRGGRTTSLSIDVANAEAWYLAATPAENPETLFERRWAFALLARVKARLREEYSSAARARHFEDLVPFLCRDSDGARYEQLAAQMGLSAGALRTLVHRMRKRYRELLREEISETVASPEEIDDEIRFLISVLST